MVSYKAANSGQTSLAFSLVAVHRLNCGFFPTDDEKRTAWEILSDYLDPEMSSLLAKHVGIKEEPVKKPETNSKPITLTGSRQLPAGTKENARPLEDYSEDLEPKSKMQKLSTPGSAKQKALAKSAAGSKSITSFFTKK